MAVEALRATREVHRGEIDGVPVFWAEAPEPHAAALVFRTGYADETIPTSGITHLVEHLALWQFGGDQPYEYNGIVESTLTIFYAAGAPDRVASFLTRTAEALADLPLDKLEAERRILETEEASGGAGPIGFHRHLRFGATGHALPWYIDLGLRRVGAEEVSGWTRERFTADNAALWLTGPPAPDLRLPLARGRKLPLPALPETEHRLPMFTQGRSGGVVLSFVARRSPALGMATRIALRRIQHRLRYEEGVSYEVCTEGESLTAELALETIWADCLDEHAQAVAAGLLEVLRELADRGPTQEELREDVDRFRSELDDPNSVVGQLDYAVRNVLFGREVQTEEELLREDEETTADAVADILREALATAIVSAPEGVERPEGFNPPGHDRQPLEGETFWQKRGWRERKLRARLIIGGDGFRWEQAGDEVTIELDRLAGVLRYESGYTVLIRDCGCEIEFDPARLKQGERAVERILEQVPPELVVPLKG